MFVLQEGPGFCDRGFTSKEKCGGKALQVLVSLSILKQTVCVREDEDE